jgi:predicted dehydrogenase
MDLMIHDLDLVLSMTDAPIKSVSGSGMSVISNHEDVAETRIEFECGMVANLKASRISPTPARQMQLFGSNGFAEIDFGAPSLSVVRPCESIINRSFNLYDQTDNPLGYSATLFSERLRCESKTLEPRNAILDELHDFVISIQTGIAPTVDGVSGARAVDIAQRVLEAIDERIWYANAKTSEIGPHAYVRERIEQSSRRIHRDRRAA